MISLLKSTKRVAVRMVCLAFELIAGLILVLCATEQPAKAYADPGSAALLWQLFFAALVSIGFQFRKLRMWFTGRWHRREEVIQTNGGATRKAER